MFGRLQESRDRNEKIEPGVLFLITQAKILNKLLWGSDEGMLQWLSVSNNALFLRAVTEEFLSANGGDELQEDQIVQASYELLRRLGSSTTAQ